MIYLTGDIHGGSDMKKLSNKNAVDKIQKDDYLIICGDFGLVWDTKHETFKEKSQINWLNSQKWITLFVDGNHECFPRLYTYPEKEWHGGKVHVIRDRVLHLERGQMFEIEGHTFYTMGGATSHDRGPAVGDTKSVGKFWWPEELPSEAEYAQSNATLEKAGHKADYIITHCLPTSLQTGLMGGDYFSDHLTDYFEDLMNKMEFKHWYCGHYHVDKDATDKISVLFSNVITLGDKAEQEVRAKGEAKYKKGANVRFNYNGEVVTGQIMRVMPWGNPAKKGEPCYNIQIANSPRMANMLAESDIIEKI